jgi:hypothetical protein
MNKLETRIQDELDEIDIDSQYDDFLDEIYPDCTIAGMDFFTSRVLKELDPTAYRCGKNDWISSENFVEINGDYYNFDECERVKDNFVFEIESEIEALEEEVSEEEDEDEPDTAKIAEIKLKISDLESKKKEWENYSF